MKTTHEVIEWIARKLASEPLPEKERARRFARDFDRAMKVGVARLQKGRKP